MNWKGEVESYKGTRVAIQQIKVYLHGLVGKGGTLKMKPVATKDKPPQQKLIHTSHGQQGQDGVPHKIMQDSVTKLQEQQLVVLGAMEMAINGHKRNK